MRLMFFYLFCFYVLSAFGLIAAGWHLVETELVGLSLTCIVAGCVIILTSGWMAIDQVRKGALIS